jgi:hypothetical protein
MWFVQLALRLPHTFSAAYHDSAMAMCGYSGSKEPPHLVMFSPSGCRMIGTRWRDSCARRRTLAAVA